MTYLRTSLFTLLTLASVLGAACGGTTNSAASQEAPQTGTPPEAGPADDAGHDAAVLPPPAPAVGDCPVGTSTLVTGKKEGRSEGPIEWTLESPTACWFTFDAKPGALGRLEVSVTTDTGQSIVKTTSDGGGANAYVYFASNPGQKYRVTLKSADSTTPAFDYVFETQTHEVADAFEPNDDRATASPIAKGKPIEAFLFAGFMNGKFDELAWPDDWYAVDLAAGNVKVTLGNTSRYVFVSLELFNVNGDRVQRVTSKVSGEDLTLDTGVPADKYYVKVGNMVTWNEYGTSKGSLPEYYTKPYRLLVTQ